MNHTTGKPRRALITAFSHDGSVTIFLTFPDMCPSAGMDRVIRIWRVHIHLCIDTAVSHM